MNTAMINNLFSVAAEISYGEKVLNGLIVTVVGVLAVFSVLAVLWGTLALFKVFFYDIPEKKKKAALAEKQKNTPPAPEPVAEEPAVPVADDSELIAVITAAVAAYTAKSGNALPFRVVSYKRVRGAGGWSGADENETF
ncbi:MAG: OadG family protein [Clostridia bacterium]|nr:OadG family protein [Clostridia bacterium]